MKSERARNLYALLLREWILMRTWMFSLTLIFLAGPVINLLNAFGSSRSVRISSVFASLYTMRDLGTLGVVGHRLSAMDFGKPVPIFIQGAPPASLWVIAIATVLGALLATIDRQTAAITDTFNAPVRKSEWIQAKFLFGTGALVLMVGLRTMVLVISNTLSPWHFEARTIFLSSAVNLSLALAAFSVVFFMGLLVGNVLLAWSLGFLALAFPLVLGADVRFLGSSPGFLRLTYNTAYALEHNIVLKLSPFWYTDYNSSVIQHFPSPFPSPATHSPFPSMTGMTVYTSVNHPWLMTSGSIVLYLISFLLSLQVFAKVKTENFGNLFVSKRVLHASLTFISLVFGSVAAQIIAYHPLLVCLLLGLLCYGVLWLVYRQMENMTLFRFRQTRA